MGNLALAFLAKKYGFAAAIKIYREVVGAAVEVLPISFDQSMLIAELSNGAKIRGEAELDNPPRKLAHQKIRCVRLVPRAQLNPTAEKVLRTADKIVVGPGSLFGSLLANFAVAGFTEIFEKARGAKILVLNNQNEFGCRSEKPTELAARFPATFDQIWVPAKKTARWSPRILARKISA